jgi:hypothetical protein
METDYPAHLLAREPAPPYDGEGPFALWHFSEDLAGRHAGAGIELRITPSIWPFWRRVVKSTVAFSGCRLRNSATHPDRFG